MWTCSFMGQMCRPTVNIRVPKRIQNTDTKHWPVLIFCLQLHSSWSLLLLCLLFNDSTDSKDSKKIITMTVVTVTVTAFIGLTLLIGRQEEHPACKNWVMRCWCGQLSRARCRLFAWGPLMPLLSRNPITSCLVEIQTGFTFLVPAYPGSLGKEAVKRMS